MALSQPLNIIIVEKNATLKLLSIKDFKEEELFKKCGFKKADDFVKQTQWNVKMDGIKYLIEVHAKTDGRANSENKYDFPPPIDSKLFFGIYRFVWNLGQNIQDSIFAIHLFVLYFYEQLV